MQFELTWFIYFSLSRLKVNNLISHKVEMTVSQDLYLSGVALTFLIAFSSLYIQLPGKCIQF